MGGIKIISMATMMEGTDGMFRTKVWESGVLVFISRTRGVTLGKWLDVCNSAFTTPSPCEVVRD